MTEIIIGTLVILVNNGVWLFMFRMAFNRIKSAEDKMIDKETCKDRHGQVVKELDKSTDKFSSIDDKITKILVAIGEVSTKVDGLKKVA